MDDRTHRLHVAKGWAAVFVDRPDVLASIIADLLKQAYALPGRIGQRPMPYESDVDLAGLIYGDYTEDPFDEALPRLMGMSVNSLSYMAGVPEPMLLHALLPQSDPKHVDLTMDQIESVAASVDKPPHYFVEWRVQAVTAALAALLHAKPGIATSLFRNHIRFEEEPS